LGFDEMVNPFKVHLWLFLFAAVVAIPLFVRFGMYRAVMRYFGNDALPRSIVFNYWWLSLVIIGGLRLCMRQYFKGVADRRQRGSDLMTANIVDWIYQQRRLEP
jgi:FlaA1/EpsC-like NDP-sugar epimerase